MQNSLRRVADIKSKLNFLELGLYLYWFNVKFSECNVSNKNTKTENSKVWLSVQNLIRSAVYVNMLQGRVGRARGEQGYSQSFYGILK